MRSSSLRLSSPERRLAEQARRRDQRIWPIALIVGMLIVILMNAVFIWIAVSGRDTVVDTYQTETR